MTSTTAESTTSKDGTRKPVELGRYEAAGADRILVGRRIEGVARVYDAPLPAGRDRTYLVESGITSKVELAALVGEYRRQAERLGEIPMSRDGPVTGLLHHPKGPRLYVAGLRVHHGSTGVAASIASLVFRTRDLVVAGFIAVAHDRADFPWRDRDNH